MPKERTHTRLSKRDLELIVAVVVSAHRRGWTVAEVVRQRLVQNETVLSMCGEPDPEYVLISSETRRLLRLRRRFASWQSARPADGEGT